MSPVPGISLHATAASSAPVAALPRRWWGIWPSGLTQAAPEATSALNANGHVGFEHPVFAFGRQTLSFALDCWRLRHS